MVSSGEELFHRSVRFRQRPPQAGTVRKRQASSKSRVSLLKLRIGMASVVKRLNLKGGLSDISEKCALQKRHRRTPVGG